MRNTELYPSYIQLLTSARGGKLAAVRCQMSGVAVDYHATPPTNRIHVGKMLRVHRHHIVRWFRDLRICE